MAWLGSLGQTITDWAVEVYGIHEARKTAEIQAETQRAQYKSAAAVEETRNKRLLYLGIGLIGAAMLYGVLTR